MFARYYYHSCHKCKKLPEEVRFPVCGKCQLVSYCSKSHQQSDWPRHKVFCKAISSVLEPNEKTAAQLALLPTKEEKYEFISKQRFKIARGIEQAMNECVNAHEYDTMVHQNRCRICCISTPRTKFWCPDCKYTSYCSAEHMEENKIEHKEECAGIKLCFEMDTYFEDGYTNFKYFLGLKLFPVPNDMTQVFKRYSVFQDVTHLQQIALSGLASYPLSLAYGMRESNNKNLSSKKVMDIHVLTDGFHLGKIARLLPFHLIQFWYPKLKKLNILIATGMEEPNEPFAVPTCDNLAVFIYRKTITQYLMMRESLRQPDVVMCLNQVPEENTLHRDAFSDWLAENPDVTLIATDMCKCEVDTNIRNLLLAGERKEGQFKKTEVNPFKCLRPCRAVNKCTCILHYENHFITVF